MARNEKLEVFNAKLSEWHSAYARVWKAYAKNKNPNNKVSNREFAAFDALMKVPAENAINVEQKLQILLMVDSGEIVPSFVREALTHILNDLMQIREAK